MPCTDGLLLGGGLVAAGLLGMRYAATIARIGEVFDAIGSTTPADEVEPADWNVSLTGALFGALALVGGMVFLLALVDC